jgi:hypothetical protein
MKPMYDGDKISHLSTTKKIICQFADKFNDEKLKIYYFGLQDQSFSKEEKEFLKQENGRERFQVYTLKTIRAISTTESSTASLTEPITQAGVCFMKYLQKLADNVEAIHMSFSLESINVNNEKKLWLFSF